MRAARELPSDGSQTTKRQTYSWALKANQFKELIPACLNGGMLLSRLTVDISNLLVDHSVAAENNRTLIEQYYGSIDLCGAFRV